MDLFKFYDNIGNSGIDNTVKPVLSSHSKIDNDKRSKVLQNAILLTCIVVIIGLKNQFWSSFLGVPIRQVLLLLWKLC